MFVYYEQKCVFFSSNRIVFFCLSSFCLCDFKGSQAENEEEAVEVSGIKKKKKKKEEGKTFFSSVPFSLHN